MDFTGKVVLVTGGTSGIGLAIAEEFERLGAVVLARGLPELDVSSQGDVAALVAGLERLDVLVNCAGMIVRDEEFEMPTFLRVLDVNLAGAMRLSVGCKELLVRAAGCIVNIASVLSFFGGARVPAYSASKGGIAQLTKSLAVAWAGDGVRVNAVAPGWIATPLTQPLQDDAARASAILGRTPMGRWGRPEEIARVVVFPVFAGGILCYGRGGARGRWVFGGLDYGYLYGPAIVSANSRGFDRSCAGSEHRTGAASGAFAGICDRFEI